MNLASQNINILKLENTSRANELNRVKCIGLKQGVTFFIVVNVLTIIRFISKMTTTLIVIICFDHFEMLYILPKKA